jgi:hypothetical protein
MANNPRADHFWKEKLQKRERFADFAYTLARIDWQLFTTHTFKNPMPRLSVQYDMYYRWLYQVSKVSKVPYGRILMALRGENGERGGRHHFHSLLGGVATGNIMTLRSQMMRLWKMTSGNADGDFRIYDGSLAGADYICKCLTGANEYELNKYSLAEETTLSKSVFRVVRTLDEMADRRCGKLNRKNGQVSNVGGHKPPAQHGSGVMIRPESASAGLPGIIRL